MFLLYYSIYTYTSYWGNKMHIKILSILLVSLNISAITLMQPTSKSEDLYDGVILDGTYSNEIDRPSVYLGFEVGERVAAPYQISNAVYWVGQNNLIE